MTQQAELTRMLNCNNGYLSCRAAAAQGVSPQAVSLFARRRGLTRAARGLYHDPNYWEDSLYVLQHRYKDLIFSHETALFLLGLSEREPGAVSCTFPTSFGSTILAGEGVKVYKVKQDVHGLGAIEIKTMFGHTVHCYCRERTIVDLIRSRSRIDQQEMISALKGYVRTQKKTSPCYCVTREPFL